MKIFDLPKIFLGLFLSFSLHQEVIAQSNSAENSELITTAKEAYIYGLPLVLTDLTRLASRGNINQFGHLKVFPDHTFKTVVRPNNDTFYSSAFLDLANEPIVLNIPDLKDRYAVIPLSDAFTNVFASFGKRTTGTKAQKYIITGPKWKGKLPAGIQEVKSPTDLVWIIGRIQVNSPEDGKNFVSPIQEGLTLTPLGQLNGVVKNNVATSKITYSVESTNAGKYLLENKNVVTALKQLSVEEYFNYLNELLVKNPSTEADKPAIEKFAKIGIKAGQKFSLTSFNADQKTALNALPTQILSELDKFRSIVSTRKNSKPDTTIGHFGTDYLKRASVAYLGLGALGPEDAAYLSYTQDTEGQILNGQNKYVIHFEPNQTPPSRAFWSITPYDKGGYLVENPIRRYAIGDRSNLKYNADGSLDIFVQKDSPGVEKDSNWLPVSKDEFNLSVRIYWPKEEYLKTGNWTKPPIQKNN
ncbi:DUF1254 domain-containing protein [Flavobacterium sp. WC2509]|uniref:DUF1254 domain-containing protein n=1 Tax=Flavobacterium sp. WC2509 TaxID=3461406 RepID=UPI0040450BAB